MCLVDAGGTACCALQRACIKVPVYLLSGYLASLGCAKVASSSTVFSFILLLCLQARTAGLPIVLVLGVSSSPACLLQLLPNALLRRASLLSLALPPARQQLVQVYRCVFVCGCSGLGGCVHAHLTSPSSVAACLHGDHLHVSRDS